MKRILLSSLALLILGTVAIAQVFIFPYWPIVGSGSYCASTTNTTCTSTIAAGPSIITGNETIPANTNSTTGGPANVYISLKSLSALPIQVVVVTTPPAGISASNISGGVLYTSTGTITSANITLPAAPIDQQQYIVASNRTITTLSVTAGGSASMGGNVTPTVLTASTTAPQNYHFIYNAADTSWYRLQ